MFLLIACTLPKTPDEVALRACRGMPGLEVEAAGQALLKQVIDPQEWALWREDSDYGPVIERIGLEGYGTVRANVSCQLESLDAEGADVVRSEPDLDLMADRWDTSKVVDQPRSPRAFRLEFRDGLVHLDLAEHRRQRDEAMALAEEQRWDDAIAALNAITMPDPMLPLWVQEVHRQRQGVEDEARLQELLEELDEEPPPEP